MGQWCGRGGGKKILVIALCAFFCVSMQRVAKAQQTSALPVEDVARADRFGQLVPIAVSPDGKSVAYTVQERHRAQPIDGQAYLRSGVPPWASGTDIYVVNIAEAGARKLTGGKGDNWMPVWSPDGRHLAFLSDRDGDGAGLWVWDATTDKLKKASDVQVRADQIHWTPDGRTVLVTVVPRDLPAQYTGRQNSLTAERNGSSIDHTAHPTAVVYEGPGTSPEKPEVSGSGPWNLDMALRDLVAIDFATGQATTLVGGRKIATCVLSPDGSRIAYTVPERFEKPGSQQILFDLELVEAGGRGRKTVASNIRMDYDGSSFSWSPDSRQLSFRTGGMEETTYDCYVVDESAGIARNLTSFNGSALDRHNPGSPLWSAASDAVYFLHDGALWRALVGRKHAEEVARVPGREITHTIRGSANQLWTLQTGESTIVVTHDDIGKQDGFYRVDLGTGASHRLLERGECYTCANVKQKFGVTTDGQYLLYFGESADKDEDLWFTQSTFENPRQLTHLNPQFSKYRMGAALLVSWMSDDGERLQGALLLPSDYQRDERYPLVVWVYGGATLSNHLNRFGLGYGGPFNLQLLATRGYAVLLPDAPLHAGTPMLDLAKTVLPGVNKVIETGVANPDGVGVIGHSYGGYSALALIVQSGRFKAAIDMDGYGDLVGHYGEMAHDGTAFGVSIEEQGQGLMGGPPWELPLKYVENSPAFHLDRVVAPLLIVHGGTDEEIRPFLGEELFVGLRRLGKTVEFVRYEGEGHSPTDWSLANQVDLSNRVISWFDTHLKGKAKK